jgi:heptosyltransferase I
VNSPSQVIPPADFNPKKILCLRLARLGDVILMVPALKALRNRFPQAHLSVLTGHRCAPILALCPEVNEVISIDRLKWRDGSKWEAGREIWRLLGRLRHEQYDLVIDFHGFRETNLLAWISGAPWRIGIKRLHGSYLAFCFSLPPVPENKRLHAAEQFCALIPHLGGGVSRLDPLLTITAEEERSAWEVLSSRGVVRNRPLIGLNVGAGSPGRVWPAEKFARLARYLNDQCQATPLLMSGPLDGDFAQTIQHMTALENCPVVKGLSLPLLAAVISQCRLLVSNDTGPMHLGPALGVPTLGLFSLGFPENYRPLGENSRYLVRNPIENLEFENVRAVVHEMLQNHGEYDT